ncbi:MAG TPA: DUF4440 domain-containing protein [Chitinophagaceae bacterium]|jgi:uncharacterized protein (TIGR02246 family)|nr:DUF4440 domain-containing protein [Chitinophagaceae bacterium]
MKLLLSFYLCFAAVSCLGQSKDETEILALLHTQTETWNAGDIDGFMKSYWQSDSLLFIGKNGVSRGWKNALENYKRGYPDTTMMGKLSFDILYIKRISDKYYYVVGKWNLQRTVGDLTGHYDLLLKKIDGQWLIVADHSS